MRQRLRAGLVISVQPLCRRGRDILHGVADVFRDKHFVARFCNDFFTADSQSQLSRHDGDEFVRRVNEIIPLSAGRVSEQIAGVTPLLPVVSDLITVERHREFMTGTIGHGHITGARFL